MQTYHVLGIMSGTSLDGLDLALCKFVHDGIGWNYAIEKSQTTVYPDSWHQKLEQAHTLDAFSLLTLHKEYGRYLGEQVKAFLQSSEPPDLIASHGHTVFHRPEAGITFQIGDGAVLAATTGLTTVCDFRTLDMALGGQGAPLVPVGDELLFGSFDYCLNLGGFANISFREGNNRLAFDICPVNILVNHLANKLDRSFDENGDIGRKGRIIDTLLTDLESISYYSYPYPKSLGREWLERFVIPLFNTQEWLVQDMIRTAYQHITSRITACLISDPSRKMLVTGGGACNTFLMELLKESTACSIAIPDMDIIQYKEALIFAFLGLLKTRNEINCLSSVTGSREDSSSGVVYSIKKR
jgi:anhydro-N-acetylmuramic acid kinase